MRMLFVSSNIRFPSESRPVRNFYIRRAFRILPFFWLNVAFNALRTNASATAIFLNLCLAFGFSPDLGLRIVPGSWSLFVEETFYLFFPILFFQLRSDIRKVLFGLVVMLIARAIFVEVMTARGVQNELSLIVSLISYQLIELPSVRFGRALIERIDVH